MGKIKKYWLYVMAVLYIMAGINHFWHPETYLKIIPYFLPLKEELNYLTGVLEILLGGLLFFSFARRQAAWGLIVLLILIFPANVQMAFNYALQGHPFLWLAWLRLPLQLGLIWWAYIYTYTDRLESSS